MNNMPEHMRTMSLEDVQSAMNELIQGKTVENTDLFVDSLIECGYALSDGDLVIPPTRQQIAAFCEQEIQFDGGEAIRRRAPELVDTICHPLASYEGDMAGWQDDRPTVDFLRMLARHEPVSRHLSLIVERQIEHNSFLQTPDHFLAQMDAISTFAGDPALEVNDLNALHRRMTKLAALGKAVETNDPARVFPEDTPTKEAMDRLRRFEAEFELAPIEGPVFVSRAEIQELDDYLAAMVKKFGEELADDANDALIDESPEQSRSTRLASP